MASVYSFQASLLTLYSVSSFILHLLYVNTYDLLSYYSIINIRKKVFFTYLTPKKTRNRFHNSMSNQKFISHTLRIADFCKKKSLNYIRLAAPIIPALFPRIAQRTGGIIAFSFAKQVFFMYAFKGSVKCSF